MTCPSRLQGEMFFPVNGHFGINPMAAIMKCLRCKKYLQKKYYLVGYPDFSFIFDAYNYNNLKKTR